jgi:hypothetical protein
MACLSHAESPSLIVREKSLGESDRPWEDWGMRRPIISLSATAALLLCASVFSAAQANPFASSMGTLSADYSPLETIGCQHAGDNCPYGKRIVRHSGHGTTCEPCESKKDESSEGNSSSQKEESNEGRHPSGSSHHDEGRGDYGRQDEGYAHGDRDYDRHEGYQHDEGYDRRDEGYAHGYQERDRTYDPGDQGYSRRDDDGYDQQGYGHGDGGYDPSEQGYDSRGEGYGRGYRGGDYGPYNERPYGWQQRDCLQFGQDWYCRQ